MKTVITVLTMLIALGSGASALNISSNEEAGVKIVEWSPQLLAEL